MKIVDNWCQAGNCPCPVLEYLKQQVCCFSDEEIFDAIPESELKIKMCLKNQLIKDAVCRDGELWCPDNPF